MEAQCKIHGGPEACPYVAEGDTVDEVVEDLEQHAMTTHPTVYEEMQNWSDAEWQQWRDNVRMKAA